jgi:predicted nucleic acid-binding protein
VTRYLLDTNIISNVTKPYPSATLLTWMAEQVDSDLFISALTVGEIRRGLLEKPKEKTRCFGSLVQRSGRTTSTFRGPRARVRREGGPHLGAVDG